MSYSLTKLPKPGVESISISKYSVNAYENKHKGGIYYIQKPKLDRLQKTLGRGQVSVGFWNMRRLYLLEIGQDEKENSRRKKKNHV